MEYILTMDSPRSRKEFTFVDHSAVYFENERLADKMRQQVETLTKDKHRLFLSRQAEIAGVVGYFDKLQAFRQAVTNTAAFRLTAILNTVSTTTNNARSNEDVSHQETIKTNTLSGNSPEGEKKTGEFRRPPDKKRSRPETSENIYSAVQNDSINGAMRNQIKNRHVRTAWHINSQSDQPNRMSPFDRTHSASVRDRRHRSFLRGNSILDRQASAPLYKTPLQFGSPTRMDSRGLDKRPSSCKEQWAGLTERPTLKRNSSTVTNWNNFRSTQTRRVCTPKCIEVLTLRRLREIYILEEPEVGMSGHRRANLTQHLLSVNQKQNQTLQEKVRNFLVGLGEKRRKTSVGAELLRDMNNLR